MHVKTTRRRRGDKTCEYLSLVESVRDGNRVGHRTLLRLGEVTALRSTGELERIVSALEAHLHRERLHVAALEADAAPSVGSVAAVAAVWERLGLDDWFARLGGDSERGAERLGDAVFAMVANRLVDRARNAGCRSGPTRTLRCPTGGWHRRWTSTTGPSTSPQRRSQRSRSCSPGCAI